MNLYENELYMNDVRWVCELDLPWDKLRGKSILISGCSGLLGSFFVDVILSKNLTDNLNCTIYALGRSRERAVRRFGVFFSDTHLVFMPFDVRFPFEKNDIGVVDYIIHLASNTHPVLYSTDPIGTITTNILGLQNMLEFAVAHGVNRFAFASSNEIYGENRGDTEKFDENYCGYINSNTLRAGYPESKRCGEALCQAYKAQKGLDVVIPRFTRSYGPTMIMSDTKAISQFIKCALDGQDIILKSAGTQFYSYTYVADAISGLLTVLLKGNDGEAYNIAEERSDIMLKDLATIIADISGKQVIFEMPDIIESKGYSVVTKARLDGSKLIDLGWRAKYDIRSGLEHTIDIMRRM